MAARDYKAGVDGALATVVPGRFHFRVAFYLSPRSRVAAEISGYGCVRECVFVGYWLSVRLCPSKYVKERDGVCVCFCLFVSLLRAKKALLGSWREFLGGVPFQFPAQENSVRPGDFPAPASSDPSRVQAPSAGTC